MSVRINTTETRRFRPFLVIAPHVANKNDPLTRPARTYFNANSPRDPWQTRSIWENSRRPDFFG